MEVRMHPVKRLLIAIAIAWAALSVPLADHSLAGEVLDHIRSTGILRSPAPDIWPPQVIKNEKGEYDGFDVEVLREVARRMGVKVEYVTNPDGSIITWDEQVSGNWQGKYDIVVGGMTPTKKRAEHIAFPATYHYGIGVLAVHRDNTTIRTPADASRKRIGALAGSQYENYLKKVPPGIVGVPDFIYKIDDPVIVSYEHEEDVYAALEKGDGAEIDGLVNLLPAVMALIKEGKPFKIVGQPLYRVPHGVAILPGDNEFAALIKKTVDEMHADGTLKTISMKWYDFDLTSHE
ncbi:MAG: transporter substrate-binding domain-containing protein [Mesorhizobium sp.]|nr:transporter substrate-binding domain-containing protein [Mesorhizobium sp. M2A.F.Ca.ET.043.02.1.1]RUW42193.1 transporter substrate-binding domain-containing protein [Mesorhizobium sp. M2A.F.Ca.ET.015.02.1.1]RUW81330.1 transporter substrate-binding domain-containing protein [Mesorhizobium sp. M2A.F.Ca.ET.067.02.1.1]RVC94299.1 transporter substrate-binding domain-containing protein [Mesorhizobium sp. M2A.F.Ca.ET.017.03.2.1]RVD09487.1 transporter substrate-binding domain-containing protein [Mes